MEILILIGVCLLFTAFVAMVFSVLTLLLGKLSETFEVTGPEGWTFLDFYLRYLIVAAVYTFVTLPLTSCGGLLPLFLGLFALISAYKYVFDAGWQQAFVIGFAGGIVALILFMLLLLAVLQPLGLIESGPEMPDEQFEEEFDFEEETDFGPVSRAEREWNRCLAVESRPLFV
jgi:hypothetical protein